MPNTTNFSLPYPQASDTVDIPRDFSALAGAVDTSLLQTVRVFASTTARDTAITSPTAGMTCYIDSNDVNEGFYTYIGAAWRKGPGWNAPWGVIGRVSSANSQASVGTTYTDVTDLSITFTAVANRFYKISAYISAAVNATATFALANIIEDATTTVIQTGTPIVASLGAGLYPMAVRTYTAGSHTVKVQIRANTGTILTGASATNLHQMVIEDIGPSGAPA